MGDNVWAALVKGCLGFAHSRVGDLVGTSFNDTGALVKSVFDGSPAGISKTRLQTLKDDIAADKAAIKPVIDAIKPQIDAAKAAVTNMAAELGTNPFTFEAAGRAATELAFVLIAFDAAMDVIADTLAAEEPAGPNHDANAASIKAAIKGIDAPWKAPFQSMAASATAAFDAFCHTVLKVENGGSKFAAQLAWSRPDKRITVTLASAGPVQLGPLNLDGASVEAFFTYLTVAKIGVTLKAKMKAGLRNDALLQKIIPGEAKSADTDPTALTLDSVDGLTFGAGKTHKLVLPVRFSFPGIELREFAIAKPDGPDKDSGRIDIMTTIAGKLGTVLGVVAEGGGVTITWTGGGALDVKPKPPFAAGLRVNAGVVKGGGFMRYTEDKKEYGGVLDLQFTKIGITAIGLVGTEPFSMVIVIGVHFLPKIELGFGFTLGGLGGLLAIERTMDTQALSDGLKDGAIGQLLFPENPIDAAPQILDRLALVFPAHPGGFVIGPIAELGWGSQAGFLKARIGIVLSLPDPKLVILGAMEIGVPSADIDPKLRIIDIHAELLGEFTADFFFLKVSLSKSKLAGLTISGDIGILVRWGGGAAFALSVGGFFPKYVPPPELAGLRRIEIEMSPPVPILTVHVTAYLAVTSNTIQFGGSVTVTADLGPVSAKAWISLDALFQWSPRFFFVFIIDAGIEVKAFGATLAGVTFHGELSGTHPWHLEGTASVKILFWHVHADIGPTEWGDRDTSVAQAVSPVQIAAAALSEDKAWTPLLPDGADTLVRLAPADMPMLVHPLGRLEVKQLKVPLETAIDRIGSNPVTTPRVNLSAPTVGGLPALAVSHASDLFPPGHFITMTTDQQAARPDFETFPCGMRIAASTTPQHGAPVSATYAWDTVYPHEDFERHLIRWDLTTLAKAAMYTGPVASAARGRGNAYMPPVPPKDDGRIALFDPGTVSIRSATDLKALPDVAGFMTTTLAAQQIDARGARLDLAALELVAVGVAA